MDTACLFCPSFSLKSLIESVAFFLGHPVFLRFKAEHVGKESCTMNWNSPPLPSLTSPTFKSYKYTLLGIVGLSVCNHIICYMYVIEKHIHQKNDYTDFPYTAILYNV